jgi:hypothetical protein
MAAKAKASAWTCSVLVEFADWLRTSQTHDFILYLNGASG